ncbi:GSCOCT00002071001.2-RA-CDS [Cotesia congregata]|uniref:Caspase_1_like_Cc n=1 Tax=Cotesia congregata TaxID=51543 RepID=A0A8J2MTL0_COTCN|nr:GSCOCT00002071001.2-RA-CDS [Cotesia congregata]CAG5108992.1 Caspase_1_like_Cc [Cotesia congregata]
MNDFQFNELKSIIENELDSDKKWNKVTDKNNHQDDGGYKREIVTHYEMDKTKRNYAVILNHEIYDKTFLEPSCKREGTNVDCKNLIDTLEFLSFEVDEFSNLTYSQIVQRLRKVADMDHTQHNCLLIVVMTHGDLGILYAYDTMYYARDIWSFFTPEKCPSLVGKPKLFFMQACQGKLLDDGSILSEQTVTDGSSFNFNSLITDADFLVFYASVADHRSFRNEQQGSWFIQTVCRQLRERATKEDILTVLTYVIQHVALDFVSRAPEKPLIHEKKQTPCIISRLTKLLQFYPKNESD